MSVAGPDESTPAPPAAPAVTRPYVHYPDCDGEPMSDNTEQWEWMVTLKGNLDACLPDFVASDLLWYPVEGDNKTRMAPDVMVAFGRPKGGSMTGPPKVPCGVPRSTRRSLPSRCEG